jgi:general secretion pathway protein G
MVLSASSLGRLASRRAFTLLEILVVVAIIVMLAGVGSYYIMQRFEDSKLSTARMGVEKVSTAVKSYKLDHGDYPTDLNVLMQKSDNGYGPYLKADELKDPWKNDFVYDIGGNNNGGAFPDVSSRGPNGNGPVIGNWMSTNK